MDENALHFCSTQAGKNEDIWMVFEGYLRSLLCWQILFHIRLISMSHQRQEVVLVMNKSRNTKFFIYEIYHNYFFISVSVVCIIIYV